MAHAKGDDHWTAEAYQNAASFVPKLATEVIKWLDVQEDDHILDIGCGDGVLTHELATQLTTGSIHGIDSSASMIQTATCTNITRGVSKATFELLDATLLSQTPSLQNGHYDKVFSNAALHWILREPAHRRSVLLGAKNALKTGGAFVFELGGHGNVSEMHTALLMAVARRIGITRAREIDPWFFPDEKWMIGQLEEVGFRVEKSSLVYRATSATKGDNGGVEGWVKLMGKQFFDAVAKEGSVERELCVREVMEVLKTVCATPSGEYFIGYVRLRMVARKV